MNRRRALTVPLAVLAVTLLLGSDPVAAKGGRKPKPPPEPADPAIAYTVGLKNGGSDLFLMDADGSNPTLLLEGSSTVRHEQPGWSPDGDEIVFRRESDTGGAAICSVGCDGRGLTVLAPVQGVLGGNGGPAWSPVPAPDGREWIAFVSSGGGWPDVYVVRPDGTGLARLIETPDEYERDVSWSPDAKRLAVRTLRTDLGPSRLAVYELSVVEGDLVAKAALDLNVPGSPLKLMWWGEPEWARTGDRIAVSGRDPDTGEEDIWIVPLADPRNPTRIRIPGRDESHPSWSPDDGRLVFSGDGIWTVAVDGTGLSKLQGSKRTVGDQPTWRR